MIHKSQKKKWSINQHLNVREKKKMSFLTFKFDQKCLISFWVMKV